MADNSRARSFLIDEATDERLENMRWEDRKNLSEFIRWLVDQEWQRRQEAEKQQA